MRGILFFSLLATAYIFSSKFKSAFVERFVDLDGFPLVRKSQAWVEGIKKNTNDELNRLLNTMPADLAMLTYIAQHPELKKDIEDEIFPQDTVTRSSYLDSNQLVMRYDERLEALREAKFAFLNDSNDREQFVYRALKSDPICRGIFAKVLMNDVLFGCLLNNLRLGGDLDYCFFDYFAKNPADFKSLSDAFRRFKSNTGPTPNVQQGMSSADVLPLRSTPSTSLSPGTKAEDDVSDKDSKSKGNQEKTDKPKPLAVSKLQPARVMRVCVTSYGDAFPQKEETTLEQLYDAKRAMEDLRRSSVVKSLDIKQLQKDLAEKQEELSDIKRACGHCYMPTSQWLPQGTKDCDISASARPAKKPILPYQMMTYSEVPRQQ